MSPIFQNAQQDLAQEQYQNTSGFVPDIFKMWFWRTCVVVKQIQSNPIQNAVLEPYGRHWTIIIEGITIFLVSQPSDVRKKHRFLR